MAKGIRKIELLSPAANADTAIEAILHGADAVYIGGPSHGARQSASNSLDDIRRVVEFAHPFRARVYVTVNTLVYEHELRKVERLITDLYKAGVDAIIVQDMSILRLDIPPIALHASTQCDTRTPEKARFLQEAGFSQIVLARELSLKEIEAICREVSVPVECFVHGALCVSYSGRCNASQACTGRSANRGECSQMCRLPYTLTDASGRTLAREKHLLSLRDFNALDRLDDLIRAGASSFKIEGRLKDASYVKNVTAAYRKAIDSIIEKSGGEIERSSYGVSEISFSPRLDKSFNRGFTHYFLEGRKPDLRMATLYTPKSMGEEITDTRLLNPGDGISYFNREGEYCGAQINGVENGRLITRGRIEIPKNAVIHRTSDIKWQQQMTRPTAKRRIALDIEMDSAGVTARDERGAMARVPLDLETDKANRPQDFRAVMGKLGNTNYILRNFKCSLPEDTFIPNSQLAALRRNLIESLDRTAAATYPYDYRRRENTDWPYPSKELIFSDNVANTLAESFYKEHGVEKMEWAMETEKNRRSGKDESRSGKKESTSGKDERGEVVMTTRYCALRELGLCLKEKGKGLRQPLHLESGRYKFILRPDCARCEMQIIKE